MGVKDLTGQKFGKLTVIEFQGLNNHKKALWKCICECGNDKITTGNMLTVGDVKSCGNCYSDSQSIVLKNSKKIRCHDLRINRIWNAMKRRCYNPNAVDYSFYGGRGIEMCDSWKNSFWNFYKWGMNNGYQDDLTIERKDDNGNYEPENCNWVNRKVQANNTRRNHFVTINGETKTVSQWADQINVNPKLISARLERGWFGEKLLLPSKSKKKNKGENKSNGI